MASIAGDTVTVPGRPAARRLRAAVLAPRGGGTTRRRASDAFRLILAVIVVVVSIVIDLVIARLQSRASRWRPAIG